MLVKRLSIGIQMRLIFINVTYPTYILQYLPVSIAYSVVNLLKPKSQV